MSTRESTPPAAVDAERADGIELPEIQEQTSGLHGEAQYATQAVDAVPPIDNATLLRLICAGYSFFCAGVNDGSLGPMIPYILRTYNISTNLVSIVYD